MMNRNNEPHLQPAPSTSSTASASTITRTRALLQGDERFRILVESARDYAIFFMDVRGCVVDWNIGAERILGFTEDEIIGQSGEIVYTPEDRAEGVPSMELEKARTQGRAEDERWHMRKDGSRFWGSGIAIPLFNDSSELIGYAKVMRDFTERKCAEEERAELMQRELEARQEAESANRAKDEFITMVAHELRTPIGVAMGWVHMLLKENVDDEIRSRALPTIQRTLEAQNQVINDLLDVSRIATGKIALQLESVDIAALVTSVTESIRPVAEIKSVRLDVVIADNIEPVTADAERIQQVLLNLLGNAIKFTPHNGQIEVRLRRVGTHYSLSVTDTGVGIEPEYLPRIFERYLQTGETGALKHGLGLGLWLVRHIVELHGGTVQAFSEGKGKGATFTVELPLHPSP